MSLLSPQEIQMKIAELQDCILKAHPRMPMLLREIHTVLKNDPDNVALLSEEDIGILVQGLMKQTDTEIATNTLKKKVKLKDVGLMDL